MAEHDPLGSMVHKAHEWIAEVQESVDGRSQQQGYQALRAGLHAIRDRLPLAEVTHLGAELPLVVRGIYYEGWSPAKERKVDSSRDGFLADLRREVRGMLPDEAEEAASAVFDLLSTHVSAGEIDDVLAVLPDDVRRLWLHHGGNS